MLLQCCICRTSGRVGMWYEASPGDNTAPQVYQGGLALAPFGSTIASVLASNEDGSTQIATETWPGSSLPVAWSNMTGTNALAVGGGVCKASVNNGSACVAVRTGRLTLRTIIRNSP